MERGVYRRRRLRGGVGIHIPPKGFVGAEWPRTGTSVDSEAANRSAGSRDFRRPQMCRS